MLSRQAKVSSASARSAAVAPVVAQAAAPATRAVAPVAAPATPLAAQAARVFVSRKQVVPRASASNGAVATSSTQEKTTNPLNLVFVATEVAPWSKTGGWMVHRRPRPRLLQQLCTVPWQAAWHSALILSRLVPILS